MKRILLALLLTASIASGGLLWNGNTDYISFTGSDINTTFTEFSFAAWLRWDSGRAANGFYYVCDAAGSTSIIKLGTPWNAEGKLSLNMYDDDGDYVYAESTDTLSEDVWYFVAWTCDGTTADPELYYKPVNGAWEHDAIGYSEKSGTNLGPDLTGETGYIGNNDTSNAARHSGEIAFVGVWFEELTENQLKMIMNNPRAGAALSSCKLFVLPGMQGASTVTDLCRSNASLTPANLTMGGGAPFSLPFGR